MLINLALAITFILVSIGLFFFMLTRGALLLRALTPGAEQDKSHIYPIYTDMRLIRLIDYQPVISAILLFQYHRLVANIVAQLGQLELENRQVLITSCAFGNVIQQVVSTSLQGGAQRILVADIVQNELIHARSKLADSDARKVDFIEDDATAMQQLDGSVDVNVMFFLLHELPQPMKQQALAEAMRVLAPGGTLLLAEFHRPSPWLLRALSWTYFKVFEPYGLSLWDTHDPIDLLQRMGGWHCQRKTFFFGNFQVIRATKI